MHILFAKVSWYLLVVILFVRPLAEVTESREIRQLIPMRKYMGIACGFAAILHAVLFMVESEMLVAYFTDATFWSFTNLFGWGNVAFVALMIPFITSTARAQRYFKTRWKKLQMFSYMAFICGGIHVSLATHSIFTGILPVILWAIIWGLAEYRRARKN